MTQTTTNNFFENVLYVEELVLPETEDLDASVEDVNSPYSVDWRFYVRYLGCDRYQFVGTRRDDKTERTHRYPDVSMVFKSRTTLADFMFRITDMPNNKTSKWNMTLYRQNTSTLETTEDVVSYDNNYDSSNDLVGFDKTRVTRELVMDYLRFLRDTQ